MKPNVASLPLRLVLIAALVIAWAATPPALARDRGKLGDRKVRKEMRFAAEVAAKGLWREALYRWKKLLAARPHDPRLLNNIAVAEEALGLFEEAARDYARALEAGGDRIEEIRANADLFRSRPGAGRAAKEGGQPARNDGTGEP